MASLALLSATLSKTLHQFLVKYASVNHGNRCADSYSVVATSTGTAFGAGPATGGPHEVGATMTVRNVEARHARDDARER